MEAGGLVSSLLNAECPRVIPDIFLGREPGLSADSLIMMGDWWTFCVIWQMKKRIYDVFTSSI
jgi:hypothetical protein